MLFFTDIFLHCSIDCLVQCCPEKANLIENFCSGYLMKNSSEWCSISGNLSLKTPVLVGLITK